jgi:S-adenosylmethionine hydrolase
MIITLTTDFGLSDPFVGTMKGVILAIAPSASIVDITHDINSYDVMEGAFILDGAYRYFPEGTIHVVIVDPGVGSARRPIAMATQGHIFVAPDNGILSFVLDSDPRPTGTSAYHITNRSLFNSQISNTFHGRDIFAPVAAHLARGAPIDSVGPLIVDYKKKLVPKPRLIRPDTLLGTALRVDKFGNIITNIRPESLKGDFAIRVAGLEIRRRVSNYAEADQGEFFAIEGSSGYIELALNQGSAAERLNVGRGAEIEVETTGTNQ